MKRTVSLPKYTNGPVRKTPKKQNCPVRPIFGKIVQLDRFDCRDEVMYESVAGFLTSIVCLYLI